MLYLKHCLQHIFLYFDLRVTECDHLFIYMWPCNVFNCETGKFVVTICFILKLWPVKDHLFPSMAFGFNVIYW